MLFWSTTVTRGAFLFSISHQSREDSQNFAGSILLTNATLHVVGEILFEPRLKSDVENDMDNNLQSTIATLDIVDFASDVIMKVNDLR